MTIVAPTKASSNIKSGNKQMLCLVKNQEARPIVGCKDALKLAMVLLLGGGLVRLASAGDKAKASLVEYLLAKSTTNKELNDRGRLATIYANTA
ncbi:hypothetical protein GOP47_0021097 [Adiantum capillus-veneris]|uniref:Uncharacterized protein n=1 Tax=Adiantum capillus-veneris TaxID=13818 RepID=A0A9D4UAU7_ADICA|nr:hypothetical protein GOP47_0021097 [Adiantum capillus-veneris]